MEVKILNMEVKILVRTRILTQIPKVHPQIKPVKLLPLRHQRHLLIIQTPMLHHHIININKIVLLNINNNNNTNLLSNNNKNLNCKMLVCQIIIINHNKNQFLRHMEHNQWDKALNHLNIMANNRTNLHLNIINNNIDLHNNRNLDRLNNNNSNIDHPNNNNNTDHPSNHNTDHRKTNNKVDQINKVMRQLIHGDIQTYHEEEH
eukprot:UN24989